MRGSSVLDCRSVPSVASFEKIKVDFNYFLTAFLICRTGQSSAVRMISASIVQLHRT